MTRSSDVLSAFHVEHEQAYGFAAPDEPVEFVNLRLTAIGKIARPQMREIPKHGGGAGTALKTTRPVYFAEVGGFVDCSIYDRYRLQAGDEVSGPSVVEEVDSTTVIHPGYRAVVDRFGNLYLQSSSIPPQIPRLRSE